MNKKEKAYELGWKVGCKQTEESCKDNLMKILEDIETDLHTIRANITPTYDMSARKQVKELLNKIRRLK